LEDEVEGEDFDDDDDDLSEDRDDDDDDDESEDEVIRHFCHSQYSQLCLQKKQKNRTMVQSPNKKRPSANRVRRTAYVSFFSKHVCLSFMINA